MADTQTQDAGRNILFGLYDDEEKLLDAVKAANADHLDIDTARRLFTLICVLHFGG